MLAGGINMSINKTRGFLYMLAKLLGDVNAVKKGTIGKRMTRRIVGKATSKAMRKFLK